MGSYLSCFFTCCQNHQLTNVSKTKSNTNQLFSSLTSSSGGFDSNRNSDLLSSTNLERAKRNFLLLRTSIIDEMNRRRLVQAIETTNLVIIRKLIRNGFPLNSGVGDDKFPALHLACKSGNLQVMTILIEKGKVDINLAEEIEKWTPLMVCCINGHAECCAYLIYKKANLYLKSEEGKTAKDYAENGYNSTIDKEKERFLKIIELIEENKENSIN